VSSSTARDRHAALRRLVQDVNQRGGVNLAHVETADLGETAGAAFVVWPDGRQGVVTLATVPVAAMHQAAEILEMARGRRLPVPRHELIVELERGQVAVVQERLPGLHASRVDADLIDTLVEANHRFVGLLTASSAGIADWLWSSSCST